MTMRNNAGNKKIGSRIKQLRKEKSMTQVDLARKLNVSRSCIANWESGQRCPEYPYIKEMAVIFGVPMDYLYGAADHRYNIKIPDYFELDLTLLNELGLDFLGEVYKFLISNEKYRKPKDE
ncbi:MAG: helix-turn-helix domain-containing protein [Firmicutes bacterium]|nr:helix-turn-helix domain-containing protein [Bacillota bacterium]